MKGRRGHRKMPINIWPRARTPDKKVMGEQYFVLSASAHVLFTIQRSCAPSHTYSIIMCVCVISRYGGWRSHQAESGCIPGRISGATIKIMPPPPSSFRSLWALALLFTWENFTRHTILSCSLSASDMP
jgi:hypothetical protein